MKTFNKKRPELFQAFLPLIVLVSFLSFNVFVFDADATSGSNQLALIFSAMIAALIALQLGVKWKELEKGIIESISAAMPAILVLLMIGALSGTWLISGVVPAMIYYGLNILSPGIFLFAACFVCSLVSVATGSSWTTVATVGIALLGIGEALGFSPGMVAGAIISGAYFGDKISPLSDTTNLASAMAGTDLFTHIRYMTLTTVPSILIALILYLTIGISGQEEVNTESINQVKDAISATFVISPILFLVPVLVIILVVIRIPAFPALLLGAIAGAVAAIIFQPQLVARLSESDSYIIGTYTVLMKAMYTSISIETENAMVTGLLSSKGMEGMLNTIWLILSAMIFGGVMEFSGLLFRITESIVKLAHSTVSLISSTVATCIFFNLTASDQYLSLVVPGRMFRATYKTRGLKPENLSRSLEDGGTVTSVLVPWNTCGATQAAVLGVATVIYLPYCFFNILSPFMTIFVAAINYKIAVFKASDLTENKPDTT